MLAAEKGLLKTTKDQLIKHYHKGKDVMSLCHITGSVYLVGFDHQMIAWNEETDKELFKISDDRVDSMRRVMTSNQYILKTLKEGVKLLSINDF